MGHDVNPTAAQKFLQPLLGYRALELAHFWRIDAPNSDPLASDANGISINGMDLEITQQSHFLSCFGSKSRKLGLLVSRPEFVASFGIALRAAIRWTFVSRLFVCGEAI